MIIRVLPLASILIDPIIFADNINLLFSYKDLKVSGFVTYELRVVSDELRAGNLTALICELRVTFYNLQLILRVTSYFLRVEFRCL